MKLEQTIQDFKEYLERINMFNEASAILSFDSETVAPPGSVKSRAKRAGFFELEIFNMQTSTEMAAFLDALEPKLETFDDYLKGMYRISKKAYDDGIKIPPELVQEFEELTEEAVDVWKIARAENDFKLFAPYLKRLVELQKKMIDARRSLVKGNVETLLEVDSSNQSDDDSASLATKEQDRTHNYRAGGKSPYDILLNDYEFGMNIAVYDEFFSKIKATVVPLLKQIQQSKKKIEMDFVNIPVNLESQRRISVFLANKLGYDLDRGYITESVHPFCDSSNKYDVRITTRYLEADFLSSFFSIMHECGHAIYEQDIADDIATTILGEGASTGIHEGSSRFYENIIGRSMQFWEAIKDELMAYLPKDYEKITPHLFYEAVNEVKPSLIRVEADELTYNLHIMIRYEIERMLFNEDVDISELPLIWNQKYEEYLGITPPTFAEGILQDIHWAIGMFGYFPTYALGSAYAAQIAFYMAKDFSIEECIKDQDFYAISQWLEAKIYQYGSTYTPDELMKKSFGETINVDYYISYLKDKFIKLYELD